MKRVLSPSSHGPLCAQCGGAACAAGDVPRAAAGGGGFGPPAPYWQAGPFKALRPADVVGTWIALVRPGHEQADLHLLLVGDRLRGVVCGRCDNTYTIGAMENVVIVGDTLYFDIVHQDWGESDPPTFNRNIVAQVVQNEMIAAILGKDLVIDPANPPARPAGRGFTLVGPIAPEGREGTAPRASTSGDQVPAPPSSRRPAGRRSGR